ncbi:MAG: GatB/YqeY domain-containing protein [Akkermansiaceae bacterium]|jgi:hypothetical protein|nr:GatB/YqeY domain-containing protein [Akkermansiaceae bacterium]
MSTFAERIQEEIKTAMKAKDAGRLTVLRALKTALTNAAIEKGNLTAVLDDSEALAVVRKQLKQREDSASQFDAANRPELAAKEREEMTILQGFLPAALSADEINALVDAAITETGASGKADMGKVMKLVQERAAGRADGKTLSQEVAKRLS